MAVCLESARWFCELLRAGPAAQRLAVAVGRLAQAYAAAAEVAGEHDPQLLPVRELLLMVARAAGEPNPSPGVLPDLAILVARTDPAAFARLREGHPGYRLRGFEAALDREVSLRTAPPADAGLTPPRPDERLHVVHVSCARQDETPGGTPEVSAVMVRHYQSGQSWPFAAYQSPERGGPAAREAGVLRRFYRFVGDRPDAVWLHWNMNEARFGFAALAERYRLLTGVEPPDIPAGRQFDLSEYLKRTYGPDYVGHPRLHRMIELNGLQGTRYLDPEAARRAWGGRQYAVLLDGLSAKVSAVGEMYRLLWDGRLRIEGGWLVGIRTPVEGGPGRTPPVIPAPDGTNGDGPHRSDPPADGRLAALRSAAGKLRLKGNEAAIVDRLCRGNGRVPLADLAAVCEWDEPWVGTWNSARQRLNEKLKRYGWRLYTHDQNAVAEALRTGARK